MDKKALVEAAKEFGRYAVFAVLGLVVTMAGDYVAKLNLSPEVVVFITFVLTNVGRIIDKYKYVSTKEALTKKEVLMGASGKGLLPF